MCKPSSAETFAGACALLWGPNWTASAAVALSVPHDIVETWAEWARLGLAYPIAPAAVEDLAEILGARADQARLLQGFLSASSAGEASLNCV